jgi:V8-like Glu-specific endopeptidase
MAFAGYLDNDELNELTQAAVEGDLLTVPRESLLSGIPGAFVAGLNIRPAPLDQFGSDLVAINAVERMAGGTVPIVELLKNAAFQLKLRGRSEASVFERLLNRTGNLSEGVPPLPDPAYLPEIVQNEQIIGDNDTLDLAFLSRGLEIATAVARLSVPRFENGNQINTAKGSPWITRGTAWLIAQGLAITNHHVVNARLAEEAPAGRADLELQAENAVLDFDFDQQEATVKPATIAEVVATSTQLDYALLELTDAPQRTIPKLATDLVVHGATTRMAVNIVQHPRGEYKQVAFRNNLVTAADAETLRYYTDTDYGSSGSPVCDDRWRVVALHRGARHAPGAKYQGREEAYVNFGTQMYAIFNDLDPDVAERIHAAQR